MKTIKIGLIGAGAIARRAHLPIWRQIQNSEVVTLADLDIELAKRVSTEFKIPRIVSSYEDVLKDSSIDIVDICTPTHTHYKIAMEALDLGKHVVVEKPLTLSLRDSIELYDKIRSTGQKLCVIQNYRYIDAAKEAKKRLLSGRIGRIISIHGNALTHIPSSWTRSTWLYHPRAVLYDFTPHLVDLILWLTGDSVLQVFAVGKNFTKQANFLASAQIMIIFNNRTVAMLDTSWVTNAARFDLHFFGTGGFIYLHPMRDFFWEGHSTYTPLDETRIFSKKMIGIFKGIIKKDLSNKQMLAYKPLLEEFVSSLSTNSDPPVTVDQAIQINAILEASWESIQRGKTISIEAILEQNGASQPLLDQLCCTRM